MNWVNVIVKCFKCLKMVMIKALFKFTDLYIYISIDIYRHTLCVYVYIMSFLYYKTVSSFGFSY